METLKIAVATDDGTHLVSRHFGDAEGYDLYDVTAEAATFVERVVNGVEEETRHADPKKARGIAGILKPAGVQGLLNREFGPNLKRMRSRFVCVLSGCDTVDEGLRQVRENFPRILAEWKRGEEREAVDFRAG